MRQENGMKRLAMVVVIGLIGASIATYFVYAQTSNSPVVVTNDGITAQVQSCVKTNDNQFQFIVLLTANPSKVNIHLIESNPRVMGWGGTVSLMRDGRQWMSLHFQGRNGTWTATAPMSFPLIQDPNYNCQLGVWTPVITPDS